MCEFPDVEVRLSGGDGNVFVIIGTVERALKRAGHRGAANKFRDAAFSADSYQEVINLATETVNVI